MFDTLKVFFKKIAYGHLKAKLGNNSFILRPRKIINPECLSIGNNSVIGKNCVIYLIKKHKNQIFKSQILIGNNVYIGHYCQIHSVNKIEIKDGCVLSDYIYISDVAHGLSPINGLIMEQPLESKGDVYIGENSFIGYGSTILPGVKIGKYCIIGARSVVTKNVPDYTMISGNPAKVIKKYNVDKNEWEKSSGN